MLGKLKHKQPVSGMQSCCKQHICSLSTKYEEHDGRVQLTVQKDFMVVDVQTIVVFWVSTLGSSGLSDISQKCTATILWVSMCGSEVDAEMPGQKECVSSTGRLGGMLSSQEVHEEEEGAGLVPNPSSGDESSKNGHFQAQQWDTCRIL